jgi:hypothetical protein
MNRYQSVAVGLVSERLVKIFKYKPDTNLELFFSNKPQLP